MEKRWAMPSRKNLSKELDVRGLQWLAARFLRILKVQGAAVDIFLAPHREMAALKRHFFKKYSEPNVISFPEPAHFPHPETKKRYLGEIYLNRDLLKKNPSRTEPLLLHGILHLLGYDHEKDADAAKMEHKEAKIMKRLR